MYNSCTKVVNRELHKFNKKFLEELISLKKKFKSVKLILAKSCALFSLSLTRPDSSYNLCMNLKRREDF